VEERINIFYKNMEKTNAYWVMTAEDEAGIVGHITLRVTNEEKETVRLGFVLINDARRGQGLGKELVALAIKYAQQDLGAKKISLGVFKENVSARRCYEALGFTPDGDGLTTYQIKDEIWDCLEMIYVPRKDTNE
jgi:RimJ/RimL family protein N-acetyltransferase